MVPPAELEEDYYRQNNPVEMTGPQTTGSL
jgi:hypothetical protein